MTTPPSIPSGGFYNDLPPEAQRKIHRDFQALAAAIVTSSTEFDAYLDPSLTVSNAGTHHYINMAELVAHETWASTRVFNIGVKQTVGTSIKEPSHVTTVCPGPISMTAPGHNQASFGDFGANAGRQRWDLNGGSVTVPTVAYLSRIELTNTNVSFFSTPITGNLFMNDCRVNGPDTSGAGGTGIVNPCTGVLSATGTVFAGVAFGNSVYAFECHLYWNVNGFSDVTASSTDFIFDGGTFTWSTSNGTLRFNCARIYFRAAINVKQEESSVNSAINIVTTANSVGVEFDLNGTVNGSNGVILTIPSMAAVGGNVTVKGNGYSGVTFGGLGTLGTAHFDIDGIAGAAGSGVDISGPAEIRIHGILPGATAANNITLRGTGIRADFVTICTPNNGFVVLNLVGLTDSIVTIANDTHGGASGQCYAFDAACTRNILILGGLNNSYANPSTDAGTKNRVITEDTDTLLTRAAALSPSILNGEVAAVNSGVSGVFVYPPPSATVAVDFNVTFELMGG